MCMRRTENGLAIFVRRAHTTRMTLSDWLTQPQNTSVALGAAVGVAHTTVLRWAASQVPVQHLVAVSEATGIPAADLRPDLAIMFGAVATHDPASGPGQQAAD
jgi:hypothetical protein